MSRKRSTVFPGRYELIGQICDFVLAGASEAGFDSDDTFQVNLACDEACTNIIEHAYNGEDNGEIFVSWEIRDDNFIITLHDNGEPFDPATVPKPMIPADPAQISQLQVGGLGLHLMRKVMDDIHFRFDDNGNVVIMTKRLPPRPAAPRSAAAPTPQEQEET